MAAARYWRIVGIETYAGGDLELSELHLYGAGGRLDAAATLTSSHAPSAGALANLMDDSTATICLFRAADVRSAGFALVWDFGAGNAVDVTDLRPGAGSADSRYLSSCSLQPSVDGLVWGAAVTTGRYPWPGALSMGAVPGGGDPNFANVKLLLAGDSFVDLSSGARTVSAVGGVVVSGDHPLFGAPVFLFNGAGARLALSDHSDFAFGTDNFTFGWWSWRNAAKANALVFSASIDGSANGGYWIDFEGNNLTMYAPNSSLIIRASNVGTYDGVWRYWEVTCSDSVVRVFKHGILVAERSVPGLSLIASNARIGGTETFGGYDGWHNGYIAQFRADRGIARHIADFTPPDGPFPTGGSSLAFDARPVLASCPRARRRVAASAPVPAFSTLRVDAQVARDVEFGGRARIWGTTKTKGTPNLPTKARVVLLHQRSKLPVRETWSDPVTGAFVFSGIDTSQQFLALAEDAAGHFRPVAASRLTPEVA